MKGYSHEGAKTRSMPAAIRKLKSDTSGPSVFVASLCSFKTFTPSPLCVSLPSPEPKLTLQGSDLWLEFPFSEGYLAACDSDKSGKTIPDSNPDASGKTSGKTRVRMPVKTLVKMPVKILEHLRNRPDATLEEVANAIGKSKRAVETAAAKLRDENRLRYVGPAKGGPWEVIEKGGEG